MSQKLSAAKIIYTGFSAGGLAALVASSLDDHTVACFGLDMVDNQTLGLKIAPELTIPFYGLMAGPSVILNFRFMESVPLFAAKARKGSADRKFRKQF